MNHLTMVCSPSLMQATKHTIKQIEKTVADLSCQHFVVVPDRFSLQAEKMVFDVLGIESTMNITVVGISRLASIVLEESGLSSTVLSTHQSVLLVRKVILQHLEEFVFFKRQTPSFAFCEELYATIQQLLASKVTPEQLLAEDGSSATKNKLHDIALIMSAYTNEVAFAFVDANRKLELFASLIPSSKRIASSRFYFCQFDSLTEQGYALFQGICQHAKEVFASVVIKNKSKNSYLFPTDFLRKIETMTFDGKVDIVTAPESINELGNHIQENLLLSNPTKLDGMRFVQLFRATSVTEEVELCLKHIKKMLLEQTTTTSLICVSVAQLQSKRSVIEKLFYESNLPYFIDLNVKLIDTSLAQFVLQLLKTLFTHELKEYLSLFKSEWVGFSNTASLENLVLKLGLSKSNLFSSLSNRETVCLKPLEREWEELGRLVKLFETSMAECNTFAERIQCVKGWLNMLSASEKAQQIALNDTWHLSQARFVAQSHQKLLELLDSINVIYNNAEVKLDEFVDILESGMNALTLAQVPVSADAILIGDASESFFPECDVMFVLGANEGNFPAVKEDLGLISDREIASMKECNISPTIQMLNNHARFKVLGDLCLAKKQLLVSFAPTGEEKAMASSVMLSLAKLFSLEKPLEIISVQQLEDSAVLELVELSEHKRNASKLSLPFFASSPLSAKKWMLSLRAKESIEHDLVAEVLSEAMGCKESLSNEITSLTEAGDLWFESGRSSVSKITSFLTCPRRHFLKEGLRAQDRESVMVEKNDVGNLLHKMAELFVREHVQLLGKLEQKDILNWVDKTLKNLLEQEFFLFQKPENAFVLSVVKAESKQLCFMLNDQQKTSAFVPTMFEQKFGAEQSFAPVQVQLPSRKVQITGIIDRIDECDNLFRIIDYKTGKSKQSLKELFFGTNIQLLFYAHVARKALEKTFAGSFVFVLSNAFHKEGDLDKNGMLIGFTPSDLEILKKMDSNIEYRTKRDKWLDVFIQSGKVKEKEMVVSVEELELLSQYAYEVLVQAVCDMDKGLIPANPIALDEKKLPCRYCYAKSVCPFFGAKQSHRTYADIKMEDIRNALTQEETNGN